MAHKSVAIPAKFFKLGTKEIRTDLSDDEKIELSNFGHQPLSAEDIAQRQLDELEAQEKRDLLARDIELNGYKYRRKEKFNSLPVGDQLDAIWKAIKAISESAQIPQDSLDMLQKIQAIKDSEPKP